MDSEYYDSSGPKPKPSGSTSAIAAEPALALEGLADMPTYNSAKLKSIGAAVDAHRQNLDGRCSRKEYVVIKGIPEMFVGIFKRLGPGVTPTCWGNINLQVVKLSTCHSAVADDEFSRSCFVPGIDRACPQWREPPPPNVIVRRKRSGNASNYWPWKVLLSRRP
jgi:hypothetical protein